MRDYNFNPRTNSNVAERPTAKLLNKVLNICLIIASVIGVAVLLFNATYYPAKVIGPSMYPTFIGAESEKSENKDIVYLTSPKNLQSGDIIVVDYVKSKINNTKEDLAIKRLIAKGGDTIYFHAGTIYVNNKKINESFKDAAIAWFDDHHIQGKQHWLDGYNKAKLNFENWCTSAINGTTTYETTFNENYQLIFNGCIEKDTTLNTYILTLPENYVFFLGDNGNESLDSSTFGPVEQKYVTAKVGFVIHEGETVSSYFWKYLKNIFSV